jgi:hypothetical protein
MDGGEDVDDYAEDRAEGSEDAEATAEDEERVGAIAQVLGSELGGNVFFRGQELRIVLVRHSYGDASCRETGKQENGGGGGGIREKGPKP